MTLMIISAALGTLSVFIAAAAGTIGANGETGPGVVGIVIAWLVMIMTIVI